MTDDVAEIQLDAAWWPLGDGTDAPEEIADVLVQTLQPELPAAEAAALRAHLASFAEWSQSLAPGPRRSFALVRTPQLGRVDALLSMRYLESADGVYEKYLALARDQHSTDEVELVNQRVLEYTLPTGRAIAVHDILQFRTGGIQQPARERCTVGFFPTAANVLIDFHVATIDLALFDDIVEYTLALAAGDDPGVPGLMQYRGEA